MRSELRGGVVVTGASTGIGRATALHLAGRGFRVFGGVRRDEDGERLAADSGGRVTSVRIDVTDVGSIAAARDAVGRTLEGERLAGIVNNAGIAVGAPLEFVPLDLLRRQFEVNTFAPVAVTQAFLPMLRSSRGRIVHVGSNSGLVSAPFVGPYCGSKFALEAIAAAMRMELRRWGVAVSIVDPGDVDTPIWVKSIGAADELMAGLPKEALDLYGWAVPKVRGAIEASARAAIPAEEVAATIARALTERRPRARYLVGRDAKTQAALARALPPTAVQALIVRYLRL
jgi:NAD(P)-dependent dehydrogenase (short-subunit alcohol dehydrogenase family)